MARTENRENQPSNLKLNEHKRTDGRYEYHYVGDDGKRQSVCRKSLKDLRDVEKQIAEGTFVKQGQASKKAAANGKITIDELFNLWIKTKVGLRPVTLERTYEYYHRYVEKPFGSLQIATIKNSDLKTFYNGMLIEKDLSKSTIKKVHNLFSQMYELAFANGYVTINPTKNAYKEIAQYNQEKKSNRADFLTKEEQTELLDFMLHEPRFQYWYPAVATIVGTGMRLGEFAGLTWQDVDLENRTININHTITYFFQHELGRSDFILNDTKTKSSKRMIPLSDSVLEALKMQREFQNCLDIPQPTLEGRNDFVFYSSKGNFINEQRINHMLSTVIDAHNAERPEIPLPRFSCHTLRHTFATRLCEAHLPIKAAQSILGHSDFQTTYNIYVGADENFVKEEFGKVMELI